MREDSGCLVKFTHIIWILLFSDFFLVDIDTDTGIGFDTVLQFVLLVQLPCEIIGQIATGGMSSGLATFDQLSQNRIHTVCIFFSRRVYLTLKVWYHGRWQWRPKQMLYLVHAGVWFDWPGSLIANSKNTHWEFPFQVGLALASGVGLTDFIWLNSPHFRLHPWGHEAFGFSMRSIVMIQVIQVMIALWCWVHLAISAMVSQVVCSFASYYFASSAGISMLAHLVISSLSSTLFLRLFSQDSPEGHDVTVQPIKNHSTACQYCFYVQRGSFGGLKMNELATSISEHRLVGEKCLCSTKLL